MHPNSFGSLSPKFKERWPSFDLYRKTQDSNDQDIIRQPTKEWRSLYLKWHKVKECRATNLSKFLIKCSQHESLEVGDYLRAIGHLCSMELGFKDIQTFLFTKNQNMMLNLIGLHCSLFCLRTPGMIVHYLCSLMIDVLVKTDG